MRRNEERKAQTGVRYGMRGELRKSSERAVLRGHRQEAQPHFFSLGSSFKNENPNKTHLPSVTSIVSGLSK
jgi:hypothetical protein